MQLIKSLLLFSIITMIGCQAGENERIIAIETPYGVMKAKLFNSTPKHRDNMVKLANEGFYDDLLFHRVINGFMIQGGDPDSRNAPAGSLLGQGGPGYLIDAEIGAPHFKGTLAAARVGGPSNPEKKSSGSQFYIVQGRAQNAKSLSSFEKQKGIKYSPAQVEKYTRLGGTPQLDMDYTVFGEVIEGLDILDKIAAVQTGASDRPVEDVAMKIKVIK